MTTFDFSLKIMNDTILKSIPFALSLRSTFKKYESTREERMDVTALAGCVLRHYLIFAYVIDKAFPKASFDTKIIAMMVSANTLFLKRFKNQDILANFKEKLSEEEMSQILHFIETISKEDYNLIPKELDNNSVEYLAYRYNTPVWIIRMWEKHYGGRYAYKILRANYRPSRLTVSINHSLVSDLDVPNKYPFLKPTDVDGVYVFEEKFDFKKMNAMEKSTIYPVKMATQLIIDKVDIDPFKGIAIFSSIPNNIYLALISRFGKNVEVEMINSRMQYTREVNKTLSELGVTSIHTYDAESSAIETCLSKKVSTFFVLPKSSQLDLLRSTPDYFLRINQQDLDSFIQEETTALHEASEQVDLYGKLIYMIPTICKKESRGVLETFLSTHDNFELVEEKQFFPFDEKDSSLYYAILNKRADHD